MTDTSRSGRATGRKGSASGVTIYDVAERAGVSVTTVSNAMNKPDRVSTTSLERVLEAIEELGFTPKEVAVSRARKGVGRIAVVAPFASYASFRTRLVGVLQASQGRSLDVVVFDQQSAAERTSPLLSSLPMSGRLDGLLIMGLPLEDKMAERLAKRKLAAVLVDSFHRSLSSVNVDDDHGGYIVGEYLVSRGYRTFAYVSEGQESDRFVSQGQKRVSGFLKALAAAGIAENELRMVTTTPDVAGGHCAATEILSWQHRPDAVFGHFDAIAAGLIGGLRAGGVRVPEDIAVVGYDDGELADACSITTVRQPFVESGEVACALLLDRLYAKPGGIQHVTLPAQLIIRSTA